MTESAQQQPAAAEPRGSAALPLQRREHLYFALCAVAVLNLLCLALLWRTRTVTDYYGFYAAGRLALSSPQSVYDAAAQHGEQLRNFPDAGGWLPFFHPPEELLIFAPLAALPYRISLALWMAISAACLLMATRLLSAVVGLPWWQLLIASCALFPTCGALYEAQDTFVLLLALCSVLYLAHRNRDGWAGIVLAAALFKPQIPLVIALAFLLQGRRRLFASFFASAAAIGAASAAFLGRAGLERLLAMIRHQEPLDQAWRMPSIRGMLSLAHAPHWLSLALSVGLLAWFSLRWFSQRRLRRECALLPMFSSAILAGSLAAFHFHGYDFALLLIPAAYWLTTEASALRLAAFFTVAASPTSGVLLLLKMGALLGIPVLVLALLPERAGRRC
jgi:hypothetical protein